LINFNIPLIRRSLMHRHQVLVVIPLHAAIGLPATNSRSTVHHGQRPSKGKPNLHSCLYSGKSVTVPAECVAGLSPGLKEDLLIIALYCCSAVRLVYNFSICAIGCAGVDPSALGSNSGDARLLTRRLEGWEQSLF
jgi:hypothetical protein